MIDPTQTPPEAAEALEAVPETLEQYGERIAAATRRKMMDWLDDDVIGCLTESHVIFGKACAMEAVTTAYEEMAEARAKGLDGNDTPRAQPSREEVARARELVEWWDTGVLRDGLLRADAAAMLKAGKADEGYETRQAERAFIDRAIRSLALTGSSAGEARGLQWAGGQPPHVTGSGSAAQPAIQGERERG